ncbi:DUF5317 domain-containing protein [Kineosporia sp. NBRC 101731]|uniref:DUF5317 domain-containing protein n=1 Tax=Kineosporia sp. NBRC 101731 TaxID=3032199 RepID=UPI0024A259CE|nr:DUF5317 domain-containing protein [Kineosporia sp. NBRC 101731]GLY26955.1 hypothetical protein Kisp02_03200 [Kineosporia sp. NBRC 101731]
MLSVLAAVALLFPAALGGRFSNLALVRIAHRHRLLPGLLLQVAAIGLSGRVARNVLAGLHVFSYLVLATVLWANRRLPGAGFIASGAFLNGLTIAVNGGTLPASPSALRTAGLTPDENGFSNSAPVPSPVLWFFGDVFGIPADVPMANVFSVGDVIVLAGVAVAAFGICGTRWRPVTIEAS